jgi:acyl-CoA synthetase
MYGLVKHHANERGESFALRDEHQRLTWSELLTRIDCVAYALRAAGLSSGDRVSVWLPNRIESTIVLLACSRNGYVCNPSLYQSHTVDEVVELLIRVNCKALFVQPGIGADADPADVFPRALQLPSMLAVYAVPAPGIEGSLPEGTRAFPNGLPGEADRHGADRPYDPDPDKVVYLAFTSGTTGAPKGVMHSDNTLLANARSMVNDWRHDSETIILSLSPLSHHIATVALTQSLVAGCEFVMTNSRSALDRIEWIERTEATYLLGVPTHAIDLLNGLQSRGQETLGRVSVFYMAGAPIPRVLASRLLEMGITPQNVYGMTECGSHQYTRPGDDPDTIISTCGRACRGYEITLWKQDDPNTPTAPGEIGEIGGRGGLLMLGYFANQSATETSFNAKGWFMSGDLGRFDDRGNLHIIGRKKDLIIRGGHNIYPAAIEALAHRHVQVAKAAAFPVPDDRLGEKVCLAIVANGAAPDAADVLDHLFQSGLSTYDMPEYFIVVDEFPVTPSGKITKRVLVEWVKSGRIEPTPVRWRGVQQAD